MLTLISQPDVSGAISGDLDVCNTPKHLQPIEVMEAYDQYSQGIYPLCKLEVWSFILSWYSLLMCKRNNIVEVSHFCHFVDSFCYNMDVNKGPFCDAKRYWCMSPPVPSKICNLTSLFSLSCNFVAIIAQTVIKHIYCSSNS